MAGIIQREESIFTFEGWSLLGTEAIIEKLVSLPFKKVQHQVSVLEAQPSKDDCIIISVTGILLVDEEQRPMDYTQTFLLDRDSTGSWFVRNDIVRFVQCV
ncbi:nuclear transport factor 2 [Penicillium ochrochloron]